MIFENKIEKLIDQLCVEEGKPRESILLETLQMLELRGRYFRDISKASGKSIKDLYIELMDNFDSIIAESNIVDRQTVSGAIRQKVAERKIIMEQLAQIASKIDSLQAQVHQHYNTLDTAAIAIRLQVGGKVTVSTPISIERLRSARGYFSSGGRIKPATIDPLETTTKEAIQNKKR